jgi:amino acid transporter
MTLELAEPLQLRSSLRSSHESAPEPTGPAEAKDPAPARAGSRLVGRAKQARASRLVTATFGVLAAPAAIDHGIGENRPGTRRTTGRELRVVARHGRLQILQGEPAMTLVPNLSVTGISTIMVAVAVGIRSVRPSERPHDGLTLIGLSILLLLGALGFLALMPGMVLLSVLPEVQSATFVLVSADAFGGLGLALPAARIHDRASPR